MKITYLCIVAVMIQLCGVQAPGQTGRMPSPPSHRVDLAWVPLYYDYAEELVPPYKSTEYGWLPGLSVSYTYRGSAAPIYGLLLFSYHSGNLTYDGSVQDQFGQVYPYMSESSAGLIKLQVRAGYLFAHVGGSRLDLAPYTGYGFQFWSRDIAGGLPTGYLEEYRWSYLPLGVKAELELGGGWSLGLDLAARFMVSGEIYVEQPAFGNPTLTLGNEHGWTVSVPVVYSFIRNVAVTLEFGYETSAFGESNPSTPDPNGHYVIEPSSTTDQFRISVGTRFQL